MAYTLRNLMPAALALSLAVAYPATHAQTSSGGSTSATTSAGATHTDPSSSRAGVTSADEAKAVNSLLAAAQLLRESIQRMAQAPAGEGRTEAIKQGNE